MSLLKGGTWENTQPLTQSMTGTILCSLRQYGVFVWNFEEFNSTIFNKAVT